MGSRTDAKIAAWQTEAGIEPATGERANTLTQISRLAYDLIRIVELERAGIRDGDGFWHGSDALDGTIYNLMTEYRRLSGDGCNLVALPVGDDSTKISEARAPAGGFDTASDDDLPF